jgi:uncharacterized membrane protein YjgN (DUF898 family)
MNDQNDPNDPAPADRPEADPLTDPLAQLADPADRISRRAGWTEPVPVSFTGSGSEYFRIWIVNLLLMLVTLGIYYPWAKARRLRYFHANTRIGEHAFSFHGEGGSMLRGFAVVGVLLVAVSLVGELSLALGLMAVGLFVVAGPMLLRLSLQFRFSQTRWRGLRFSFDGTLREAVWASALALAFLWCVLVAPMLERWAKEQPDGIANMLTGGLGIVLLCLMPFLPVAHRSLLAYRQGHIRYAGASSSFSATVGAFYAPIAKCVLAGIVVGLLSLAVTSPFLMLPLGAATWVLCLAIWHAGIQNAVWSSTRLPQVDLHSRLDTAALAWRYLLNGLGLVVTLGLYWPFAAVATAKLRLAAVTVSFGPDFERGLADPVRAVDDARGDAAADLAGLDLGL